MLPRLSWFSTKVIGRVITDERNRLEKAEKLEEAEAIKGISPIAWRHVNLLGRFEFQQSQNPINIDELIKALEQKIVWQKQKSTDEPLE